MKRFRIVVLALAFPSAAIASDAPMDSLTVDRLAALARVWGTVKLFHPALAYRDVDWDDALLRAIPAVESARTDRDLSVAIQEMLASLDDRSTGVWPRETEEEQDRDPPAPEPPAVVDLGGDVVRLVATDWEAFEAEDAPSLTELLERCRNAGGIVLDVRKRSEESGSFAAKLEDALPALLSDDLVMPAPRSRLHSGYPSQSGPPSGGYETGVFLREHSSLRGRAELPPPPIVALVSSESEGTAGLLAALQCAGLATIVQEGRFPPLADVTYHWIPVTDSVRVLFPTAEPLNPDGTVGLVADLVVGRPGASGNDPALEAAVALLREEKVPPLVRSPAPPPQRFPERDYADLDPVPREHRLLGLFRMWTIIRWFYPYHHLLDRPWEDTLPEFIPRFAAAEDREEYLRAARELAARMQDSHAIVWTRDIALTGTHDPGIVARRIEERWVVTEVVDSTLATRVAAGDIVLSVDGEDVLDRADRIATLFSFSTPQARDLGIARRLLGGAEGSGAVLELERADGTRATVTAPRREHGSTVWRRVVARRPLPVLGVLPEGFGYVDLVRLEPSRAQEALEAVEETAAVIFDMRGYPDRTIWHIAPRLAKRKVAGTQLRRPLLLGPEDWERADYVFEQPVVPWGRWDYAGRIVVLVDERAMSRAEHYCLLLEAALEGDVTFVGSPTSGTNGDVTAFPIPGGLTVRFTGHDIRHGDGRQLQRVGILPDVPATPTIEGIRRGEDEILSAAIRFLQDER